MTKIFSRSLSIITIGLLGFLSFFFNLNTIEASGAPVCAPIVGGEIAPGAVGKKFNPGHYMVITPNKAEGGDPSLLMKRIDKYLTEPEVKGVTVFFSWKELEPKKDVYDFSKIREILSLVEKHDKFMSFKVNDRSFGGFGCDYVYTYMPQYVIDAGWNYVSAKNGEPRGKCMPKMWEKDYMDRWIKLFSEIGKEFDRHPSLESAIIIDETALGNPQDGSFVIDRTIYTNELIRLVKETAPYFKNTAQLLSINSLGGGDSYMARLIDEAVVPYPVALSWPDASLKNLATGNISYAQRFAAANKNKVLLSPDADNTMLKYDPVAGTSDVPAVFDYYVNKLGTNHINWQPVYAGRYADRSLHNYSKYFEEAIIGTLKANKAKINTTCPDNIGICLNTAKTCTGTVPSPKPPVDPTKCSLYGKDSVVTTGYASPYDYERKKINLKALCKPEGTEITVGLGSGTYVGKNIQYRKQGSLTWSRPNPLTGTTSDNLAFLNAGAKATISSPEVGAVYEVRANICQKDGLLMKCNCKNAACTERGLWTIQAFRVGSSTNTNPSPNKFKVNDNIEVFLSGGIPLNVRMEPLADRGGSVIGQQVNLSTGKILAGPRTTINLNGSIGIWWQVDFATGVDGWVFEDHIRLYGGNVIPPVVTPNKPTKKWHPGHYIDVNRTKSEADFSGVHKRIKGFISEPVITGVTAVINWKDLEPAKDEYTLDAIADMLDLMDQEKKGYLQVEIMDRRFGNGCKYINLVMPNYIIDAGYMYVSPKKSDPEGKCMPALFDTGYVDRYIKLINEIGKRFDKHPRFVGMKLMNETSLSNPTVGPEFDFAAYVKNLGRISQETAPYFKNTITSLSINYIRGPENFEYLLNGSIIPLGMGLSWPDPLVREQDKHHNQQLWAEANPNMIPLMPDSEATMLRWDGLPMEESTLNDVPLVFDYYVNELKANFIYWGPTYGGRYGSKSNYYNLAILPELKKENGRINTTCPKSIICKN